MAYNVKVKILYFLTGIPDASAAISSSLLAKTALPCRYLKIIIKQTRVIIRKLAKIGVLPAILV